LTLELDAKAERADIFLNDCLLGFGYLKKQALGHDLYRVRFISPFIDISGHYILNTRQHALYHINLAKKKVELWAAAAGQMTDHSDLLTDQFFPKTSFRRDVIPASERAALIALYTALGGDSWINNDGWKSEPLAADGFAEIGTEGTWQGVVTDNSHVIGLILRQNNLTGYIPAAINDFPALKWLDFAHNLLQSDVDHLLPDLSANLNLLEILDLSYNQFEQTIPSSIANLSALQELYLRFNQFSGAVPPAIGSLTALSELWLDCNYLTALPQELASCSNLYVLSVFRNKITSPLNIVVGSNPNIEYLFVQSNELFGDIPEAIGNLTNLVWLEMSGNQLSANLPAAIGNCTTLKRLAVTHAGLVGVLPSSIGNLVNLEMLFLNNNHFRNIIPASITNLVNLARPYLDINQNHLFTSDAAVINFLNVLNPDWSTKQSILEDVVATYPTGSSSPGTWHRNSMDGFWTKWTNHTALDLSAGDINGDGQEDLIFVMESLELWVYYRNVNQWVKIANCPGFRSVACGDITGDGFDDIILSDLNNNLNGVKYYDFHTRAWELINSTACRDLSVGDFNGDGVGDVFGYWDTLPIPGVFIRFSGNPVTWVKQTINLNNVLHFTTGDMNADGFEDILGIWTAGDSIGVWWQDFNSKVWSRYHQIPPRLITTGDINKNGPKNLIGIWESPFPNPGLWVRLEQNTWEKWSSNISATALDVIQIRLE
jgi:Leucine-rich repeat (LRR) protein